MIRLKTPMYKELSDKYIKIYCKVRDMDYNGEQARLVTKIYFQDLIIDYMMNNPEDFGIIASAYESIKEDNSLSELAMVHYDLMKCSSDIRAKYMPMLQI
jgi:hypothetical protein